LPYIPAKDIELRKMNNRRTHHIATRNEFNLPTKLFFFLIPIISFDQTFLSERKVWKFDQKEKKGNIFHIGELKSNPIEFAMLLEI
jgi:hypothetical protein